MKTTIATGLLVLVGVTTAAAQTRPHMPALVTGQSQVVYAESALPAGQTVVVAEQGASIQRWDWNDTGSSGALGRAYLQALQTYSFDYLIWWQGTSDPNMSAGEYASRLYLLFATAYAYNPNIKFIIMEIEDLPHLQHIRAVHQAFATDPHYGHLIGLVPTGDVPRINWPLDIHPTAAGCSMAVQKMIACASTACWERQ